MTTHRFYDCGCAPEFEEFCKEANQRVWQAREAAQLRFLNEGHVPVETAERLEKEEREADRWLVHHYRHMELLKRFKDYEEPDEEPPDDGYDEEPRVMGHPS